MFVTLSAPVTMQWEVTDWCNHLCVHCYNYWRTEGRGKVQVTQEFHATSQWIVDEIIANRVFSVTITGGEPLVVFDDIYPYLVQLQAAGTQINLNTNLTLMTPEIAARLLGLGVRGVLTSLMADDPVVNDELASTPGAHARTIAGIKTAMSCGLNVMVNMVVTKRNLSRVFSTAKYVAGLGIVSFSATKAATPGNAQDFSQHRLNKAEFHLMLAQLLQARDELGIKIDSLEFYPPCAFPSLDLAEPFASRSCTAGRTMCTVGMDGEIRPCSHAPMNYGVIDEGLQIIWHRLNPWRTEEMLPLACRDCSLRFTCGGGCKTEAYVTSGSLSSPDPYCSGKPVIVQKKRNVLDLNPEMIFRINPAVKSRAESFGGILFRTSHSWIPVSAALFDFAQTHQDIGFSPNELASALGVEVEQTLSSLNLLMNKDIIVPNGS